MDFLQRASRVASMTQPLSDRYDYGTNELVSQQEIQSKIVKTKGKGYCVKSEKPGSDWSGGCYPTKGEAEDRLKDVEMFKHMKASLDTLVFATDGFINNDDELGDRMINIAAALKIADFNLEKEVSVSGEAEAEVDKPYHCRIMKNGIVMAVGNFSAVSDEDAKTKMNQMYKIPENVKGVTFEGPFPGQG